MYTEKSREIKQGERKIINTTNKTESLTRNDFAVPRN